MLDESAVHILGGGIGGTVGALVTCPLEVIKVRLQSSQGAALRDSSISSYDKSNQSAANSFRNASYYAGRARCEETGQIARNDRSIFSTAVSTPLSEVESTRAVFKDLHSAPHRSSPLIQQRLPSSFGTTWAYSLFHHHRLTATKSQHTGLRRFILFRCLVDVTRTEGVRALFKGIIPTLFGVLPSRGIYFYAYHKGQVFFEKHFTTGSSGVYLCAAGFGSITASSLTNPIWFVKTRLQLDSRPGRPPITVSQVIRSTWRHEGLRGFYRGVSASYVGSLETAVNFMIYENIKSQLLWWEMKRKRRLMCTALGGDSVTGTVRTSEEKALLKDRIDFRGSSGGSKLHASRDMMLCMIASACSKAIAITLTYPHEVVRTRLREKHGNYRGFARTLRRIVREEGFSGWYRGMGMHYIRQVPNSCIMIGTYEVIVFLLQSWGLAKQV